MLGSNVETFEFYDMCVKSETPCVSIKSVCGFADPFEDARFDDIAMNMSALGVIEFLATYLTEEKKCSTEA